MTESHPTIGQAGSIEVERYQFVIAVEKIIGDEEVTTEYSFELPPDTTSARVPNEILGLGDEVKIEVLAREAEGGNQSATESCFFVDEA